MWVCLFIVIFIYMCVYICTVYIYIFKFVYLYIDFDMLHELLIRYNIIVKTRAVTVSCFFFHG